MIAEFLDFISDLFISHHVSFPTIVREDQVPSLIDLVFTNDENFITEITSLPRWVKVTVLLSQSILNVILK